MVRELGKKEKINQIISLCFILMNYSKKITLFYIIFKVLIIVEKGNLVEN